MPPVRICRRYGAGSRAALCLVVALSLLGACGRYDTGASTTTAKTADTIGATVFPAAQRKQLPDITGQTLAGSTLSLRSLTGRGVVVVNVWASWCANCREESAAFARAATDLHAQGVRFVGVDEQDSGSAARSFARSTGMPYPQLVDRDGRLLAQFGVLPVSGIPSTLLIDPQGRMAARVIGQTNRTQLVQMINTLARHS